MVIPATALIGQLLIAWSPAAPIAILGATLTGAGVALGFPALGVEAMKRLPNTGKGMVVAVFSTFQDLAFGLTGPLAGLLIVGLKTGMAAAFALGAVTAGVAILLLYRVTKAPSP